MKRWYSLTCPVCGFRFPLQKFRPALKPILYPVQVVTGGGRAKGFRVERYLPWTTLPALKQTNAWNSLLCLYGRLADSYDHFYQRARYQSWMSHLTRGLQEPDFLLRFEATSDPWERSKLVGQRISELRKSFKLMTQEQRTELAKQAEVELKTGLELMGRDKKTIQDLILLVDPPTTA